MLARLHDPRAERDILGRARIVAGDHGDAHARAAGHLNRLHHAVADRVLHGHKADKAIAGVVLQTAVRTVGQPQHAQPLARPTIHQRQRAGSLSVGHVAHAHHDLGRALEQVATLGAKVRALTGDAHVLGLAGKELFPQP